MGRQKAKVLDGKESEVRIQKKSINKFLKIIYINPELYRIKGILMQNSDLVNQNIFSQLISNYEN
jgi:hypothetical protein